MINEVLWAAGMTTVNQCYSIRGIAVVAGVNIAATITNLFNIVYIQLGACISIIVGQYLGAEIWRKPRMPITRRSLSVYSAVSLWLLHVCTGTLFPAYL